MILIKTKDNLYNYNNSICIQFDYDFDIPTAKIYEIELLDNKNIYYIIYADENKTIVEKVYNEIQNQIISLNAKNESGCIDVEDIVKEVEGTKTDDRIYFR